MEASSTATTAPAGGVAKVHRVLALTILVGGVVQFLLAGYGVFDDDSFGAHRILGDLLTLISLVVLILAAVGRKEALPASGLLFGLFILQNILAAVGDSAPAIGALHPVNGLAILGVAMLAAAGRPIGRPHHP
jgi:hypothetical protein